VAAARRHPDGLLAERLLGENFTEVQGHPDGRDHAHGAKLDTSTTDWPAWASGYGTNVSDAEGYGTCNQTTYTAFDAKRFAARGTLRHAEVAVGGPIASMPEAEFLLAVPVLLQERLRPGLHGGSPPVAGIGKALSHAHHEHPTHNHTCREPPHGTSSRYPRRATCEPEPDRHYLVLRGPFRLTAAVFYCMSFDLGANRLGVPSDIWQRIAWVQEQRRRHFAQVLFVGGRRAGKGHIGAILLAYEWYRLLLLDDPQAVYGLAPGKHLRAPITATTYAQARDNLFADVLSLVTTAPCFRPHVITHSSRNLTLATPADLRRVEAAGGGAALERQMASLRAHAISASGAGARGATNTFLAFDEFAFHAETASGRRAEEIYRALIPTLSQLHGDGIAYIPTSPWTTDSYAHVLYEQALAADDEGNPLNPDFLVLQLASWQPFEDWDDPAATGGRVFTMPPERYDDEKRREERNDPRAFKSERLAQWVGVTDGYLEPDVVSDIFEAFCHGCSSILRQGQACERCDGEPRILEATPVGAYLLPYRGHADPGEAQSNFALAIEHAELLGAPGEERLHVIVDYLHVWRPGDFEGGQIDYTSVELEIVELLRGFPTMKVFSVDQYGAIAIVPNLRREMKRMRQRVKIKRVDFTAQRNFVRAERFKIAAGERRVHAYRDSFGPNGASLLEAELRGLSLVGHRLVKPQTGLVRSKDLVDAVMEPCSELLADAFERDPVYEKLRNAKLAVAPGISPGPHPGADNDARAALQRQGQASADRNRGGRAVSGPEQAFHRRQRRR
jgi:hypothetical protein